MAKALPHIIEKVEDWPINQFALSRPQFIAELNVYTYERILKKNGDDIEALLSKTIYQERQRVKLNPWKVDPPEEKQYWSSLASKMKAAAIAEDKDEIYHDMLRRIINRYSEEIVGNFNPKTFRFARKFLRGFFKRVFNKAFGHGMFNMWGSEEHLYEKMDVRGKVDMVRKLFDKGTVVFVPTHYSNIDSIMIGYAIDSKAGLPGFGFAAGLNLYDVEILAYYMSRLGAYRVDRRKRNPIYLENLKAYTSLSVIKGANSIFFPGGTRSRNGQIESNIKLGLLGSLIDAQDYIHRKKLDTKIIVVPVTLGYHFALEADSLIEQHLVKTGREKYIRLKKKTGKIKRAYRFIKSIYSKGTSVLINIGSPIDVFGNLLDEEANSLSENGSKIDTKDMFYIDGNIKKDFQRETVYTRKLADKIVETYKKENYILSSHVVAFVGFKLLEKFYGELDLYGILKQPVEDFYISKDVFKQSIEEVISKLLKMKELNLVNLSENVEKGAEYCMSHGLENVGLFHPDRPLYSENNEIRSGSFKLLYYYHNMLDYYQLSLD